MSPLLLDQVGIADAKGNGRLFTIAVALLMGCFLLLSTFTGVSAVI